MSSITTSSLKSFTLASVLAIGTTVSFSAVAADYWSLGTSQVTRYVGDCWISVGPVFDAADAQLGKPWAMIGGTRVKCLYNHSMSTTVREVYSAPGISPYFVGSPGTWNHPSTRGVYDPYILQTTGRICGNGTWYTVAYVSISGVGFFIVPGYAYSIPTGCSN